MKHKIICAACTLSVMQVFDLNAVITRPSDVAEEALSFSGELAHQTIIGGAVSLLITGPIALAALGIDYVYDKAKQPKSTPSKKSTTKICTKAEKLTLKSVKDDFIKKIGKENASQLIAFAKSINKFLAASVDTIDGFSEVKKTVVPRIKESTGADKKALESLIMTADISNEYYKNASETLLKVAESIVDMQTSMLNSNREKSAKKISSELKTLADNLKQQYIKLYLLNASYILRVDPSSEVSEKRSDEGFKVKENGMAAAIEEMVASTRELNSSDVRNKGYSECLEMIIECVNCISDINDLMVSVFKYSTTLSKQDRRKTAELMNQFNENYFSNKLSLTVTEFLEEPSSSDNREDSNVSDHNEETAVNTAEDKSDISFPAEAPEDLDNIPSIEKTSEYSETEQRLSFPAEAPSKSREQRESDDEVSEQQ